MARTTWYRPSIWPEFCPATPSIACPQFCPAEHDDRIPLSTASARDPAHWCPLDDRDSCGPEPTGADGSASHCGRGSSRNHPTTTGAAAAAVLSCPLLRSSECAWRCLARIHQEAGNLRHSSRVLNQPINKGDDALPPAFHVDGPAGRTPGARVAATHDPGIRFRGINEAPTRPAHGVRPRSVRTDAPCLRHHQADWITIRCYGSSSSSMASLLSPEPDRAWSCVRARIWTSRPGCGCGCPGRRRPTGPAGRRDGRRSVRRILALP